MKLPGNVMTPTQERIAAKRHSRLTDARLAIKQAETFIVRFPAASATETVRDMKLALAGLLAELEA